MAAIPEDAWSGIEYTEGGVGKVAETTYKGRRLVVRRTRLLGPDQKLWSDWWHFGFLTDLDGTAVELDAFHRDHARVELAIRDLKEGGWNTCPPFSSSPTPPGSAARCSRTTSCGPRS